jgi:N-acyl-D-amino-acid deacylase
MAAVFDLVVAGGQVIDGTRAARVRADVGVKDGRIAAVGDLTTASAKQRVEAAGKIVAPGFIDVHNHSDGWLLKTPHVTPKTTQGFTTEVLMADGISYAPVRPENADEWIFYLRALNALRLDEYLGWQSLEDYLDLLDGKTAQNFCVHVPYANVRVNACGFRRLLPDDFQMRQMKRAIAEGMEQGAVGLSTGLDYIAQCFSNTEELVDACSAMAAQQGLYVTHVRYKRGTLEGVKEAVEIGKRAGVPVHISHLKGTTPEEIDSILGYIDTVARKEVDFTFDVYPYLPGSTMLNYLIPYDVWEDGPFGVMEKLRTPEMRARFAAGLDAYKLGLDQIHIAWVAGKENSKYQGMLLSDYILEMGLPPAEALTNLLLEERLAVLLVFNQGDDTLVKRFLAHDLYMMGTDGIYHPDSVIHPRMYGSAGRILGMCVRDWKLFSLEDAVYKLAGLAAKRFGLKDRGVIREGACADLVVFDPETVGDRATFADPHQTCTGIEQVFVNGVAVVRDSKPVDEFDKWPGKALRRNQ